MAFKVVLLCVSALLVQSISGQCVSYSAPICGCPSGGYSGGYSVGNSVGNSVGYSVGNSVGYSVGNSVGNSVGYSGFSSSLSANSIAIPSSGGSFPVTSVGLIVPTGISVASDISLAGILDVAGALPFLSAVGFQGNYDTTGSGSVCYSCGDSCGVGINSVIGGSGSVCGCGF